MKTSSYVLIPYNQFLSDTEIIGTPQKAAAYYSKDKSVQTVSWYLTGFDGVLTIEATLDTDSDTDNYFPIHTIDAVGVPLTENSYANLEGNYTWIRATVTQFAAGSIGKVVVGY